MYGTVSHLQLWRVRKEQFGVNPFHKLCLYEVFEIFVTVTMNNVQFYRR
jgi:hypothetical protein